MTPKDGSTPLRAAQGKIYTAEANLGHEFKRAVIAVPTYFNGAQRRATQTATLFVGLKFGRIINEPWDSRWSLRSLCHPLRRRGSRRRRMKPRLLPHPQVPHRNAAAQFSSLFRPRCGRPRDLPRRPHFSWCRYSYDLLDHQRRAPTRRSLGVLSTRPLSPSPFAKIASPRPPSWPPSCELPPSQPQALLVPLGTPLQPRFRSELPFVGDEPLPPCPAAARWILMLPLSECTPFGSWS